MAFSTMGRYSHAEVLSLAGIAETAWPFLTGPVVGWLLSRGWQRPTSLAPTGLVGWVSTVVVGMVLRRFTSAGVEAGKKFDFAGRSPADQQAIRDGMADALAESEAFMKN
nr:DUF3054 domain-containing protein [Streptomyces sp. DSM 41633]